MAFPKMTYKTVLNSNSGHNESCLQIIEFNDTYKNAFPAGNS